LSTANCQCQSGQQPEPKKQKKLDLLTKFEIAFFPAQLGVFINMPIDARVIHNFCFFATSFLFSRLGTARLKLL